MHPRSFPYFLILIVGFCSAPRGVRAQEALPDPAKPGPFPVGVTTMMFVDHARTDEATGGPRSLLTEIWYPATDDARELPKNRFSDFLLRGTHPALNLALQVAFKTKIPELDVKFQNFAVRDARVRDGKFPLLLFSHGNGGVRTQSTFWCDHLASHGYIVVSPDHTGNSAVTVVDGKLVLGKPTFRQASAKHRPLDLRFLIDTMTRLNAGADSRFTGRIALDQIGAAGHSFGGFTVGMAINDEPRIKAIVPMSPVFGERKNFSTPVLVLLGTEDATIGVKGNDKAREYFRQSTGPRALVEILNGGHYSFSDMFQVRPDFGDGVGSGKRITREGEPVDFLPMTDTYEIINAYSVAFLGIYVRGQNGYRDFLKTNHYPGKIILEYFPEPVAPPANATGVGASPAAP